MLALALRIANDIGGRLVGVQAIRHLVPDFPDGTYDVVSERPWQPADGEDSGKVEWSVVHDSVVKWRVHVSGQIRVGTWVTNDIYHGRDSTKCWYNSDGTYFASASMQRLAETRTLEDEYGNLLNTIIKFESCGFHNTSKRRADVAFYEPSILTHCTTRRTVCLVVCGVLVDDRLAMVLSRCDFDRINFYECTVMAGMIHAKEHIKYENCVVLGTHNTCTVRTSHFNGYLTYNCQRHHIQFDGVPGRDTIDAEEHQEYMRLCVQFLAELPNTARAYALADTIEVGTDKTPSYYVAMSRYQTIFIRHYYHYFDYMGPDDPMEELCAGLSGAKVTIPVEWLTDMEMLIVFSDRGLVKPRHPFFAQRFTVRSIAHLDPNVLEPRNDIVSFVSDKVPWAREYPLYPVERDGDYLQMHVPLDQINDALESEGFTVETMDMLIDQIAIFNWRCSELRQYLRSRTDTPPYLLR